MVSYLILGGGSLFGRHLVSQLLESLGSNFKREDVRVVDRMLLQTGYFTPKFLDAFNKVEYIQGNLCNQEFIEKIFKREDGTSFDVVINAASEMKPNQPNQVYESRTLDLASNLANQSLKEKCKLLVHLSSSQLYESLKVSNSETSKLKPTVPVFKYLLQSEQLLLEKEGLNLIILRPGILYGSNDMSHLTPILVLAKVYQFLSESMPVLWKKEFKMNTIHATDLARSCLFLTEKYMDSPTPVKQIFNAVDEGDTDAKTVEEAVTSLLGVSIDHQNSLILNFIKSSKELFLEEANEKHVEAWSQLLQEKQILNSPLIPYMDSDNLDLAPTYVNNTKLVQEKFTFKYPKFDPSVLKDTVNEFVEMRIWPGDQVSL